MPLGVREGGSEGGKHEREGGREGGSERGREGEREGKREGGREGEREGGKGGRRVCETLIMCEPGNIYRRVRIKRPWAGNLRMQRKRGVGAYYVFVRKQHVVSAQHPGSEESSP